MDAAIGEDDGSQITTTTTPTRDTGHDDGMADGNAHNSTAVAIRPLPQRLTLAAVVAMRPAAAAGRPVAMNRPVATMTAGGGNASEEGWQR